MNREPNVKFSEAKIVPGSIIKYIKNPSITFKVVEGDKVEYNNEILSLSAALEKALGFKVAHPYSEVSYNGISVYDKWVKEYYKKPNAYMVCFEDNNEFNLRDVINKLRKEAVTHIFYFQNENVKEGDRVYLYIRSNNSIGIIGSGYTSSERGEKGDKWLEEGFVNVSFDWIADFSEDKYLEKMSSFDLIGYIESLNYSSGVEIERSLYQKIEIELTKLIGIERNAYNLLKSKDDINPEKHDGSYELTRKAVELYSKYDESNYTFNDLDFIYTLATITANKENHINRLNKSSLNDHDKELMLNVINNVWNKAYNHYYENNASSIGSVNIGMFRMAMGTFNRNNPDPNLPKIIINVLKQINTALEDAWIYIQMMNDNLLSVPLKGIKAASFSQMAHCLKPNWFPVMNANEGKGTIFEYLHIDGLNSNKTLSEYAFNADLIQKYKNDNFIFDNYRVMDNAIRDVISEKKKKSNDDQETIENEQIEENIEIMDGEEMEIQLNTILYGPPGTGKTYNTKKYAVAICDGKTIEEVEKMDYDKDITERYDYFVDNEQIEFTTFHQSYGYEDFIEGIKPKTEKDSNDNPVVTYPTTSGVFKKLCKKANERPEEKFVLIIDEINRGNISKIFGELITLIEPTKRLGEIESTELMLPYSKKPFGVPKNVYILGTMNTADRSIALMDTALRRRFNFIEMLPDASILEKIGANEVESIDIVKMLNTINERIEILYDREHTIGHAFFTPLAKDNSLHNLRCIFENKVMPLLQEYFYEDYEKIRMVLGDNDKSDPKYEFINEIKNDKSIFKNRLGDIEIGSKRYKINKDAFKYLESYKQIV